jgi:hypothetical protein
MLTDYYDLDGVDPLILPIRGKQYTIPMVPAANVARWKVYVAHVEAGDEIPATEQLTNDDAYRLFLGTVLDEMRADGLLDDVIVHAFRTVYADVTLGRPAAEAVWSQPHPKAPARPAPQDRKPKASTRSRSTAAATSTRSRARTSGTTSPQK